MVPLQRLEWLMSQVPLGEAWARLGLAALREIARRRRWGVPRGLAVRRAFPALAGADELRRFASERNFAEPCIREGEKVLAGVFTLFGGVEVRAESGMPDWLAAWPEGERWPGDYAFDIDISGRDGRDIRGTWEMSRHGDLVTLARAAFLTGEARFRGRLAALLVDWMQKNPFLAGPNWASALEVAMRGIAWAFIDDAAGGVFDDGSLRRSFLAVLFRHGLYVETFLSTGLNPSNHIIGEAAGLFVLGTKFAATDDGRRWRARAGRILADEMTRQTFEYGASREQSLAYHRFVTGLFSLCLAVGGRRAFPPRYSERLRRMYAFLAAVARPDGTVPQIGDGDDAVALRLSAPRTDDVRGDLALGQALFPESALLATGDCAEAMWLLGPDHHARGGAPPRPRKSVILPGTDMAVLRSEGGALQIEFDCGLQGYSPVSAHGHADALSVTIWSGKDRLVDAGTYRYNGARSWRDAFRGTAFHNTVTVDNQPQAAPATPFRWLTLADAKPTGTFFSGEVDWVRGTLAASAARGSSHTREVIRIGQTVIVIIDTVECTGAHTARAYFHSGPAEASADGERARVEYDDGRAVYFRALGAGAGFEKADPAVPGAAAWRSPSYGVKEPSATLVGAAQFADRVVLPWVVSVGGDFVTRSLPTTRGASVCEIIVDGVRYVFAMPRQLDAVQVESIRFVGEWVLARFDGERFVKAWARDAWALEEGGTRIFTKFGGEEFAVIVPA